MNLELSILLPAFVAGLLVLSTHVPLGREVLSRGIIFIDLAIAQIAGLGVIAASSFGWDDHGIEVQIAAASAALIGALMLNFIEKKWPDLQEAFIGVWFILAATAGILLLANNPNGSEHLKELLVGQILWVEYSQLIPVAILYAFILVAWFGFREKLGAIGFYVIFALAITASVQLVGVYLVFASLIIPAIGTIRMKTKHLLAISYAIGVSGFAAGLILSSLLDLPSGALIVWTLAIISTSLFLWVDRSHKIKH